MAAFFLCVRLSWDLRVIVPLFGIKQGSDPAVIAAPSSQSGQCMICPAHRVSPRVLLALRLPGPCLETFTLTPVLVTLKSLVFFRLFGMASCDRLSCFVETREQSLSRDVHHA